MKKLPPTTLPALPALTNPATLPPVRLAARKKVTPAIPLEHTIQSAFVAWAALAVHRLPWLALGFAVPNGGKRHAKTAAALKREGVRAGVPDWWLPVPCGEYAGLAIEFKRPGKSPTTTQKGYITTLRAAGWQVLVCDCHVRAAQMVCAYLALGFAGKMASSSMETAVP